MKYTILSRISALLLAVCLVAGLMTCFAPDFSMAVDAEAVSGVNSLTCADFISNTTRRNYIDTMMHYYINNYSKLSTTLDNGYSSSLFTGAVTADSGKVGNFTRTTTGFSSRSATVSFDGAFAINYYFTPNCAIDANITFYYWTPQAYAAATTLTPSNASGKLTMEANTDGSYWAQVTGIVAKQLDDTYYVAAFYTSNNELRCTGVIAYSLSKYCMNNAKDGNAMQGLAAATAMYGYYAKG